MSLALLALVACVRAPAPPLVANPRVTSAAYGPALPAPPAPASAADAALVPVPGGVPLDPATPALGPADARVVVVTYSDFACPYCGHFFPLVLALAERRPDLRFVFGSFPLDSDCNPLIRNDLHRYACDAALAASCANLQGRYLELATLLYQYPEHITPPELPVFADRVGLDRDAYDTCVADPAARAALTEHVTAAVALGVDATPTVFVRGLDGSDAWVQVTGDPRAILAVLEASPRR